MIVSNSGMEVFSCRIVFWKMGSIRVTSCNLLPGNNETVVAPSKDQKFSSLNNNVISI